MMIRTLRQLKAHVRHLSEGNSTKAQVIMRNYVVGRFLERVVLSSYRNNLILKGGTIVSAIVGLDNRSTMDVDAAVRGVLLSVESAKNIINDIIDIRIEDGLVFEMKNVITIMDEAEYSGVRVALDAKLEAMRIPLKIDFSSGDIITPQAITYSFKLLFEDRAIPVLAYNVETILAEKLETILTRGVVNTRMRDFYDIHILDITLGNSINRSVLYKAFANTANKRGSFVKKDDIILVLDEIRASQEMITLWKSYQRKFDYAANVSWNDVIESVVKVSVGIL